MKSSAVASCARSDLSTGSVFNIQRFSLHDGPGVRTVVFLKGCQMACAWCANPESLQPEPEVLFDRDRCQRRHAACTLTCPAQLPDDRPWRAQYADWPADGQCPAAAVRHVGSRMSVEAVIRQVTADELYYRTSGGGMTLSGGEMALQPAFSRALLLRAREEGIHCAVETSGFAPWQALWQACEASQLVLFDIKLASDTQHQYYTRVSNRRILANLQKLLEQGIPVRVRIPVIPGVNDSEQEADDIMALIARLTHQRANFSGIDLLPYHAYGLRKYALSGKHCRYQELFPEPPEPDVAMLEEKARRYGLACTTLSHCIG